jgi:L-threonylcarbamoyladenylate synthase
MTEPDIDRAVAILRAGGLVAFPTETVYGLGADAANPAAVARIFAAKGRPASHPVIVHFAGADQAAQWSAGFGPAARRLAERFWPGPLTLIVRRAAHVPDAVTGGQDTVGLRVPAHPLALRMLAAFGGGVAAPSANRYGRISPTTAADVTAELGAAVDLVLDGGACPVGIESAIVDCSGERPALLRPGSITAQAIAEALGEPLAAAGERAPRAPGRLPSHYAPQTPLVLVDAAALVGLEARFAGERVAVLALGEPPGGQAGNVVWVTAPADPALYARALYAHLRRLDRLGCGALLVETPPDEPDWAAVLDRLSRAAGGTPPLAA